MHSSPKMRNTFFFLAVAFHSLGALCQTITHITQISIYTDLPSCLTSAVGQVYDGLIASNCPQTNPSSAASCLCLKTANSVAISFSMSILVPIWCGGLGSNAGDQENLSSGLAVFSEYCTEALGTGTAGAGATPASNTPVETGAGRITSSGESRSHFGSYVLCLQSGCLQSAKRFGSNLFSMIFANGFIQLRHLGLQTQI